MATNPPSIISYILSNSTSILMLLYIPVLFHSQLGLWLFTLPFPIVYCIALQTQFHIGADRERLGFELDSLRTLVAGDFCTCLMYISFQIEAALMLSIVVVVSSSCW